MQWRWERCRTTWDRGCPKWALNFLSLPHVPKSADAGRAMHCLRKISYPCLSEKVMFYTNGSMRQLPSWHSRNGAEKRKANYPKAKIRFFHDIVCANDSKSGVFFFCRWIIVWKKTFFSGNFVISHPEKYVLTVAVYGSLCPENHGNTAENMSCAAVSLLVRLCYRAAVRYVDCCWSINQKTL